METLFFVLAKLLGALLRPETLLLLLLGLSFLALRRGKVRLATRTLGFTLACLVVVAIFPVGGLLLAPLEARYRANPVLDDVAAIVVLGGAEDRHATRRWGTPGVKAAGDRYLAALALARRFPEAEVYFTGGGGDLTGVTITEASIAKDILLAAGLAAPRLHLEDASRNTAENAGLLLRQRHDSAGRVVLVTSAAHMPRAMATFCAAGWRRVTPFPTDYRTGYFADGIEWDFADHLADLNHGAREWLGLLAYRLTGRTRTLLGATCGEEIAKPAARHVRPNPRHGQTAAELQAD